MIIIQVIEIINIGVIFELIFTLSFHLLVVGS